MKKGIIALFIALGVGVIVYFIYMQSFQPKYPGTWELVEGEDTCFVSVEFSSGPKDYKGTSLKQVDGNEEIAYLGGYKMVDDKMVVDIFNMDDIAPIELEHEKEGGKLLLTYDWKDTNLQCTYEKKSQ